jgi:uncharacterized membrane protein YphA (DoxX/SURF4 family)
MKTKNIISWIAQTVAAIILLQTLWFKFTGAEESIYIFSKLGAEPYGRIGSGIIELVAGVLLLTSRFNWLGALIGLGTMAGAILSHLNCIGDRHPRRRRPIIHLCRYYFYVLCYGCIFEPRENLYFYQNP